MHFHEYQAKEILRSFGLPVPDFSVISSTAEAIQSAESMGITEAVLKVQVHAGGRGKAGGVLFAKNRDEIVACAEKLIGMKVVNNQTGPNGLISHQVLLSPPAVIAKEFYLSALIDRDSAQAILIASTEGGMDIEEVAEKNPGAIFTCPIGLDGVVSSKHSEQLLQKMGWNASAKKIIDDFARAFFETDALLLEINPLVQTEEGDLLLLDAKMTVDESALFRHPEISKFYDPTQLPPSEARAHEHGLAYVSMEGNIGCMVNGAGLAMATMDLIHHHGGKPANFLDVGGGASKEKVAEGFRIILSDPKVEVILVNIFGGIMDCGVLAKGILQAAKEILKPLVVRMEGTNVDEGRQLLADAPFEVIVANDLSEAAEKAVEAVKACPS